RRRVGVLIHGHINSPRTRSINNLQSLNALAPISFSNNFVVRDVGRYTSKLADRDCFLDTFDDARSLVAHMRCVNSAEWRYNFLEFNDFLEGSECAWHIEQAGTHSKGAISHRLTHHLAHTFEFVRTRCPVGQTDYSFAYGSLSNEGRYIDGLRGCLQSIQKRLNRRSQTPSKT